MLSRTNFSFIILILLIIFMILGCNKREQESGYSETTATDSVSSENYISSNAAVENNKDTLRKFIRTADIKFKVKDVIKATYQIEDVISRLGGFVTYTHLYSQVNNHEIRKVSSDSSLESTAYTVVNTITLRIPNYQLDSALKAIAPLVDHMDHRTIKADDIGLQILSNQLTEKRIKKHEKRVTDAIDHRGKKLWETTDAEDNLVQKQETADNAMLSNLSLMDQVSYSTVTIDLYQKEVTRNELIANEQNIQIYEAGFGAKLWEAMYDGWEILEAFIIFIARFWGLILLGATIWIIFKRVGLKLKSKKI